MSTKWDNDEVVERFREYLRIPSVHPDIDYGECVKFIKKQADQLDLPAVVYELVPRKPVVVITWEGLEPQLPTILLNSHMDVVPVYEEHWTYPPFDACISEDGFIYARGTQDMKGHGMMYLESVRNLKNAGIRLKRTLHISFVPDEEIGSVDGMKVFSESEGFKKLNIGFGMDESIVNMGSNVMTAFHGERTSRQIKITAKGRPAHGSILASDTAGEKLYYIIDKFMKLRAEEKKKMDDNNLWFGDVTTINLTQLEGGVQVNVLPESLSVSFDIRIAPDVDHDEFEKTIERWCKEAGQDVSIEYLVKNPQVDNTEIDDCNPFWVALNAAASEMGATIKSVICPGATDARHVRRQGIPSINLTPVMNTPLLIHAHDERLHVDEYKAGITRMQKFLEAIANV